MRRDHVEGVVVIALSIVVALLVTTALDALGARPTRDGLRVCPSTRGALVEL